jgi:hypothetical protein
VLDHDRSSALKDIEWFHSEEPIIAMAWGPRGLYFSTPDAIKVFDLARTKSSGGTNAPVGAPSNAPGASIDQPGSDRPVAALLFGGAAALLIGALVFAFGGKKRGRT